jgi:hypothetical protein
MLNWATDPKAMRLGNKSHNTHIESQRLSS